MSCNNYEALPPVYINVRRENFLHVGVGNPNDAYDFNSIAQYVEGYVSDCVPPFIRVIPEYTPVSVTVYPCPDSTVGIDGSAALDAVRVICSGTFGPLVIGVTSGPASGIVFNGEVAFFGIDQVVDYIEHSGVLPDASKFDVDFILANGDPTENPLYQGFTTIHYQPDDPSNPNGNGTYFFVLNPSAKVGLYDINQP